MPLTYRELLELKWINCSCCDEPVQPARALVAESGKGVRWALCPECNRRCRHNNTMDGPRDCPIEPCRDPKLVAWDPRLEAL